MATDSAHEEASAASADSGSTGSKGPLLLALVNTLAVLGALGFLAYTKLLYQRPQITEDQERQRIAQSVQIAPAPVATPGLVQFDPVTINIQPAPTHPAADAGSSTQISGKLHYATVAFALELSDIARKDELEQVRPILMDRILSLMGKKAFHEITTVQGRYLLRSQILSHANQLGAKDQPPLVREVFFTQFVVQ